MSKFINAPNTVTLFRLLLIPLLFILITQKQTTAFIILLVIASLCDGIDGFLARRLKQETKFGTKFDSITDLFYFLSITIWFWMLFPEVITQNKHFLIPLVMFIVLHYTHSLVKFKTITSYHLYSTKSLTTLIYLFFIYSTIIEFNSVFFKILIAFTYLVVLENFIISLMLKNEKHNIKSLFHLKK